MKKYIVVIMGCIVSLAIGIGIVKIVDIKKQPANQEKETFLQKEGTWESKIPDALKSKLKNTEKCWLCGYDNRSLMAYFRKFDYIGIICTNNWYVLDFKVRNYDEEGNLIDGQEGTRSGWVSNGEEECSFETEQMSGRGISKIKVSYGSNSYFEPSEIQKHLCQECLDKVLAAMETYGYVGEPAKPRDLCLVDFQTLELYPLQEHNLGYFIRDYYVHVDSGEEEVQVEVFYAPILKTEGNN